ncbi:MAG: RNA-directed DNA polymerase [Desulfuromonadales bacterium]|nr:MAG: RNA-directed DNA polymerase [Desulfuromonadales bacterium]
MSAVDISLALGISPRLFTSFTHAPENHYRSFQIGKRGGGTRQIDSPRVFLKTVQCWVVEYFLWRLPSHPSCHSYQKDKSIQTNASPHVGKKFVANVDIENFFGSITTEMVRMLFLRNGMGEQLSKNLSKLLTLRGSLPQGSPASPIISNAFLYEFDEIIYQKAIEDSADYTRYADDMTLSGDNRQELKNMISIIQGELEKLGLRLKDTKTRIASYGGQQRVTGVVVNTRISPPRTLRRQVRAMFHQASLNPADADVRILRGYLSYLSSYSFLKESEELSKYRAILNQVIDSKNQS